MNKSIITAIALAFNSTAITQAQTATPSKPASTESKLPDNFDQKRVSPNDFKKEYSMVGKPGSMEVFTYLGQLNGRAYINYSSASIFSGKWSDRIIYVDIAELDATFRDSLPKIEMKAQNVAPAEFKKEYSLVGMAGSMHSVTYLGQRNGRAYINHSSKSIFGWKWSDRVIYVDIAELDATFRNSLPKTKMKAPK